MQEEIPGVPSAFACPECHGLGTLSEARQFLFAGLLLAELCMGGVGHVELTPLSIAQLRARPHVE